MNFSTKFLLAALAIALCAAVAPLRAADESEKQPPPPEGQPPCEADQPRGHGPRGDRLQRLAQELDLTDAQKAKIQTLAQEEREALKALRAEGAKEREAARAKAKALHEGFLAKIRAELTPEQQTKFDALPQRPRRHDGPREQCRPMPPPPPPCEGHDAPPPPPDDDDAPAAEAPAK